MGAWNRLPTADTVTRLLSAVAAVLAGLAALLLLVPRPLADVFFTAWVLFAVVLAAVGALAAWTRRTALLWVASLLLLGLSLAGMWSFGAFVAPAAVLLLGAAVMSVWAGPRPGDNEAVLEDPPSVPDVLTPTLGGIVLVIVGAGLAYEGVLVRELFTRGCASETLACAIAVTRWDAVGLAVLGLAAIGIGGWLVWRQVTVGRILLADRAD